MKSLRISSGFCVNEDRNGHGEPRATDRVLHPRSALRARSPRLAPSPSRIRRPGVSWIRSVRQATWRRCVHSRPHERAAIERHLPEERPLRFSCHENSETRISCQRAAGKLSDLPCRGVHVRGMAESRHRSFRFRLGCYYRRSPWKDSSQATTGQSACAIRNRDFEERQP